MDNLVKNVLLTPFNLLYSINPKVTLEILFRLKMGEKLDVNNPRTYNQKLQWIKLNDRNDLMPVCCDKYSVRQYISDKGYGNILNQLYWHGTNPKEIPYDTLPDQFVIKVTHGSTFNIIVTDKNSIKKEDINKQLYKWLKAKFLPCYGEWFYGKIPPQIIIEKYIESKREEGILDYKFFCFNGKVKCIYVSTSKEVDDSYCIDYYDEDWNLLPLKRKGHNSLGFQEKPESFEKMKQIAEKIAADFLHVRVDFFYENSQIVFGELTFTTSAGFGKIDPPEFDLKMGDWLALPTKSGGGNPQ